MSTAGTQANDRTESALREAGWRVCTPDERDLTPEATAVRTNHPHVASLLMYLLYVDRDLSGLVVAGAETADPHDLIAEADHLAAPLAEQHPKRTWQGRPLPFRYGTNGHVWRFRNALDAERLNGAPAPGAPEGGARSRHVFAPARPATIARWKREAVKKPDAPTLRAKLRLLPNAHLDPQRQLYDAQRRAIQGLEESFAADHPRALIQMATGAGKTYTVVQASHRLLNHAGAHRVLFLVDRTNLGDQAFGEYRDFLPTGSKKPLHEEFPLKHLSGPNSGLADSDKVVITTIQKLWHKLSGQALPEPGSEEAKEFEAGGTAGLGTKIPRVRYSAELPPDYFDFIVIDECHRSIYGRWRPVLEYFDAHIVGLTATPIGPTFAFFDNNLVSQYTYEEAVADEVNVDYDVYRISTRITREGSKISAITEAAAPDGTIEQVNTVLAHIDRVTRAQHWRQEEEDDEYTSAELNVRVESTSQVRTIIQTFKDQLFTEIFPPELDPDTEEVLHQRTVVPKTLIFAASDRHADAIVEEVLRAWSKGDDGTSGFCKKITNTASQTGKAIRDFRNKPETRIAVTVDMIATGTDIPALECLVFMRDVHTWSYFEQMKGRGARTIKPEDLQKITEDALCKDRFVIVDTEGVTEHTMVDARPLVRDVQPELPSLERLLKACAEGRRLAPDDAATLAGRLSRLGQRLDHEQLSRIEGSAGGRKLTELVRELVLATDADRLSGEAVRSSVDDAPQDLLEDEAEQAPADGSSDMVDAALAEALRPFIEREALREALLEAARERRWIKIDHLSQDGGVIAEGVTDRMRAERTVEDWHAFMEAQQDKFADLRLAFEARRPLSEVRERIDEILRLVSTPQQRWTKQRLWKAYVDLEIARNGRRRNAGLPEFLSLLRFELGLDGGEFRPYRDTVGLRFQEWLARQATAGVTYTEEQEAWLQRIVRVVATSATVSLEALDEHALCRDAGGWGGFRETFAHGEQAPDELIDELDRELGA